MDVLNDHLCYVVSYVKSPWHLPRSESFRLRSKVVITHVSKFQCRLAIYVRVDWFGSSRLWKGELLDDIGVDDISLSLLGIVETVAVRDMQRIALDVVDVLTSQVERLGKSSGTKRAIQIFGQIGQQVQASRLTAADVPLPVKNPRFRMRTKPLHRLLTAAMLSYLWGTLVTIASNLLSIVRACLKLAQLHTILTLIFITSISINVLSSSQIMREWWVDRKLTSTMRQLGVHADFPMMRGIYLQDIDKIWPGSVTDDHSQSSKWYLFGT